MTTDPAPTLLAVTWFFDVATREHIAMVADGTDWIEVDRLPAHAAAQGTGSVGQRVPAVEDAVDVLILTEIERMLAEGGGA